MTEPRPLYVIASKIRRDHALQGKPVYFGAVPYLDALDRLSTMDDRYGEDSAKSVITYLLSNLGTWRGDTARRIKAELKALAATRSGW